MTDTVRPAAKATPLYQKIVDDITEQIRSGRLAPGDRLPTEAELVALYQVSRITVSRAMNELRAGGYIVRFPNKGSFVAKHSQKEERTLPSLPPFSGDVSAPLPRIAFVIPELSDSFALNLVRGVTSVFPSSEYHLLILQSRDGEHEEEILKLCVELGVSGILLFPADQAYYSDTLLWLKLSSLPIVLLDRTLPGINTDCVVTDNREAGRLALEHLYFLGHRSFAFLTHSTDSTFSVRERINGLRSTAARLLIPQDSIHICQNFDVLQPREGAAETLQRLLDKNHVTALIVSESQTCLSVYELLLKAGVDVPGEVSLISFDSTFGTNRDFDIFTHIDQSEYGMAQDAAQTLKNRLRLPSAAPQQQTRIPTLEIRKTTGKAPARTHKRKQS
ncbi:MAG: GntR family transcriptional regulator [Eubacteriales bacterium]|nr:GntR family transcriptional regulator [Eubacteriales bacterium]